MIQSLSKLSLVRPGSCERIKQNRAKVLSLVLGVHLCLIIFIVCCLSLYTPWALLREFTPDKSRIIKTWYPNNFLEFILDKLPNVYSDNLASIVNVLLAEEPAQAHLLPSVRLLIPNNALEKLDNEIHLYNLGYLKKKTRTKGNYITEDGKLYPISFGMRGVMSHHHMIWKPSLRIKFKKTAFPKDYRNMVLIAPEDGIGFRGWLTSELGRQWEMPNYDEGFSRLFINKKYMGLYNHVRRLNETLLVNNGLLPGYLFRLELDAAIENWLDINSWVGVKASRKITNNLMGPAIASAEKILGRKMLRGGTNRFDIPLVFCPGTPKFVIELWINKGKVFPYTPTYPEAQPWPCQSRPSPSPYLDLNEMLDQDTFAKFLAILTHAGETHVDDRHNFAFYLDPVNGKLKPIPEDITGYDFPKLYEEQIHRPIIKKSAPFVVAWQKDPKNFALYINRLYELLNTLGSSQNLESLIRKKWEQVRSAAVSDLNISEYHYEGRALLPVNKLDANIERLIKFIRDRNQWLLNQLTKDSISIINTQKNSFKIFVQGFSGARFSKHSNLNTDYKNLETQTLLPSVPMSIGKPGGLRGLPYQTKIKTFPFPPAYAFYQLQGKPDNYHFTHRLTGKNLSFSPLPENLDIIRAIEGINQNEFPNTNIKPVTLGPGTVVINQTQEYAVNQPVTIHPGTQLLLDSKVSLIIRGPLKINGISEAPVTIRPIDPKKPFGVFALFGKKTHGSRIHHLDIQGGSVHRRYNLKFTGMFSVHDCPDISITNSRFGRNFIGDDAVHFMRSKVEIKNSVFENAFSDAMDWDLVNGKISESVFRNSGNDGLDLSMGQISVSNSRFEKSGDKCISAGEGTQTKITNSKFLQCNVGIAVKDRSQVELTNSLFSGNNIAYNTYRKKWRWKKGGEGVIQDTHFLNSTNTDIKGDKLSKVSFIRSIPENIKVEGKLQITSISDR